MANALSSSSIKISWNDNSSNENGFRIRRSTNGVTFNFLVDVPSNTVNYTNTGLTPNTTYYYQVGAFNACGIANNPAPASATTLP
jgi:fibronectin type 3 domain-containing protein